MKNLIILLLFCSSIFAQEEIDIKTRLSFEKFKNIPVSSEEVKDLKIKVISRIIKVTNDTILKNDANKYLLELLNNKNKVEISKPIDISKIPKEKLKNFKIDQDKFTGITYFTHKKVGSRIHIYIGNNSGVNFLRFVCVYEGFSWVFMKSIFFIIDGKKFEYKVTKTKRDVFNSSSSVNVREALDELVQEDDMELINAISNAKSDIEVRFTGDRTRDEKFLKKIALHFKETLEFYNYLNKEYEP